jgi:hypothetical protein
MITAAAAVRVMVAVAMGKSLVTDAMRERVHV